MTAADSCIQIQETYVYVCTHREMEASYFGLLCVAESTALDLRARNPSYDAVSVPLLQRVHVAKRYVPGRAFKGFLRPNFGVYVCNFKGFLRLCFGVYVGALN